MNQIQKGREKMKQKLKIILTFFLMIILICSQTGCNSSGDKVDRFAEAAPGSGANIAIPGYEKLSFAAGKTTQNVRLTNPPENACTFVLILSLDDGETLWTGKAIQPGEAFTRITLNRALDKGEYQATLHYDCYNIEDNTPLNGAEVKLTLEVN